MKEDNSTKIKYLVKNWKNIPDSEKINLKVKDEQIPMVASDEHYAIIILSRQKPSVEVSWDFDEERIAFNRQGQIIWGFDSGCSCPSPFDDHYPSCYNEVKRSWKEFKVNLKDFDQTDLEEEIRKRLDALIEMVKKAVDLE